MRAFLRESLQLLYYTYFKPSALQARLNEAAPQGEGDTALCQLSFEDIWNTVGVRRFLLQCALWWLLGLLPFWWLALGAIPWGGMLFISSGLLLAAWSITLFDVPLGLSFPLLSSLVLGLKPEFWTVLETGLAPWLNWHILGLLAADLIPGVGVVAGVVLSVVLVGGAVVVELYAASGMVGEDKAVSGAFVVAFVVANVLVGFLAVGIAGILAGVAVSVMAGIVAVGMTVGVALYVAGAMADGDKAFVAAFVVAGVVAGFLVIGVTGVVTGVVAGVVAGGVAIRATLPPTSVLGSALGLGLVFSPRRSFWPGLWPSLVLAPIVAALSIEIQDLGMASLALLFFLVGYFRLPLYPVALLATAAVASQARFRSTGANALVRRLPPFTDEIVWLPLFGLDRALVAAVEEDSERGREAIAYVAKSFRQEWAARAAWLQLSARTMARYHALNQIPAAPVEFAWLPDEPDQSLRGVAEVRRRLEEIARQVEASLNATSDYNRLRRLNQAQTSVSNLCQSFGALKDRASRHFIAVAEHWDRLISDEIARLSTEKESKADIPNPYITGIPVQPDEKAMFAPRPDLVRTVENALTATHGKPTLALYGPRRMGKTTFLLHLPRLLPDEVVPIFVDSQEAVQVSGLGGLYYNWAVAAFEAARSHRRQALPRPELSRFTVEPAIAWREWLDDAEVALRGRKLFLTFDEFEWLVDTAEKNPAMEGAFSTLRHLSQHRPRVYLLFAGAHRLEELAPGGRWHDYFINVRGLEVSYLAEPDARRLVTNPIPDFPMDYVPAAVDEIVRVTRCQPMLVQLMGSLLVDWLNSSTRRQQGDWLTVKMEDVAHAADEILSVGHSAYFANLWHDAREDGRQVLGAVAQAPDGLVSSELAQKAGLSAGDLPAVLTRLEQYRLIEQFGGRWRVQVELTRRAFAGFAKTA